MNEKKWPNGMKLIFTPGCFDNFEGTQEELDALVKEIEKGFEDGSFFEKATEVNIGDLDNMTDEELEALGQLMDIDDLSTSNKTLH